MGSIWNWSTDAASNATADDGLTWAEGQAPSTVNNSARVMMKRVAELLKDLGGALVTTNTSNAYALSSESAVTSYFDGFRVAFRASAANTGAATLNVDLIAAKPMIKITGDGEAALIAGEIQNGAIYEAIYSTSLASGAGAWLILNPSTSPAVSLAGAPAKASPVDADTLPLSDSEASSALKKVTWANVKATLEAYFDTLYGAAADVAAKVAKTGDTMTGLLKLSGSPTEPLHAAPKQYVDSHPGIAKALVNFDGSGPTATVRKSSNVASVTRSSTGTYAVALSVTMSDANYVVQITDSGTSGGNQHAPRITSMTASSFTFECWNDGGDGYGKSDRTTVCVAVFGDLA